MFKVVHFTGPGIANYEVVSEHATLSEAQAADSAIVLVNGVLIADYLDYGIIAD